jgi:hypothetical protein
MKLLAKITGKLTTFNEPPTPSLVTLTDTSNGETMEATAPSDKLQVAGVVNNGDEFEILIHEDEYGKHIPTILKGSTTTNTSADDFAI